MSQSRGIRDLPTLGYDQGMEIAERPTEVLLDLTPLAAEKVKELCAKVVSETGAHGLRDMGKCMNALKELYPGQMDFAKASGVVKDLLK